MTYANVVELILKFPIISYEYLIFDYIFLVKFWLIEIFGSLYL